MPLDNCCRLVLPYNAEQSIQQTEQISNDPPGWGRKVLILAIISVPRPLAASGGSGISSLYLA